MISASFSQRLIIFVFVITLTTFAYKSAEAADFYLGEYPDGTTGYLMTDSLKESIYDRQEGGERYDCWVKIVTPNAVDYDTTHYTVIYFQVLTMKRDGENLYTLRTQQNFFNNNPVERNLVEYINRHYRDPYGKSR